VFPPPRAKVDLLSDALFAELFSFRGLINGKSCPQTRTQLKERKGWAGRGGDSQAANKRQTTLPRSLLFAEKMADDLARNGLEGLPVRWEVIWQPVANTTKFASCVRDPLGDGFFFLLVRLTPNPLSDDATDADVLAVTTWNNLQNFQFPSRCSPSGRCLHSREHRDGGLGSRFDVYAVGARLAVAHRMTFVVNLDFEMYTSPTSCRTSRRSAQVCARPGVSAELRSTPQTCQFAGDLRQGGAL
jgi:hypothetical protein